VHAITLQERMGRTASVAGEASRVSQASEAHLVLRVTSVTRPRSLVVSPAETARVSSLLIMV